MRVGHSVRGMKVCVDGRIAGQPGGTGVATYATALAAAIPLAGYGLEVLTASPANRGRAARWLQALRTGERPVPANGDGVRRAGDAFQVAQVHFDLRRRYLPVADRAAPPALMHWAYPLPMAFRGVPNIYTVHDLIPLLHPALTGIAGPRMRRLLGQLRRHAAHLVTVSEASRSEIIRELGWPPERVTNTYQAVADTAPPPDVVADSLATLGLQPGGYVLQAGTVEPRKNVRRAVEAHRASGLAVPLVVAGPDGWNAAAEWQGLAGAPGVRRLPWVDRPTLLALIAGARIVLAPSLAEGFGLMVAEAMAFGVPVLTSDQGATAEIAGGAAMLANPRDVGALAAALRALDADPALRAGLRAKGLRRAALFSPDAYAARLRALYTRVSAER